MKILDFLRSSIDQNYSAEFKRSLVADNLRRGKILAVAVIAFETVYCIADIIAFLLHIDSRFKYYGYLLLYLAMILLNVLYLLFITRCEKRTDTGKLDIKRSTPSLSSI